KARRLDPVERVPVETRARRDAERAAAVELAQTLESVVQEDAPALRLEGHQRLPRRPAAARRDVLLGHAEGSQLVLRQVHATEAPVLGDVAEDVDQLQRDAERLGALLVLAAVDRQARATDGP